MFLKPSKPAKTASSSTPFTIPSTFITLLKTHLQTLLKTRRTNHLDHRHEDKREKARQLRSTDIHFNAAEFESIAEQQAWVTRHVEMEGERVAILQRLSRKGYNHHKTETNAEMEMGTEMNKGTNTGLGEEEKKALDALRTTTAALKRHWAEQPSGNTARAYELDYSNRNPLTNRSVQWEIEKRVCAETGGCCARGRTCGCCQKVLGFSREIVKGKEVDLPVFGHCTKECGCCIGRMGYQV